MSLALGSSELAKSFESSIGVTGLGLFLTTVIYTARGSLDLFHAICIFHLLGLAGISISPKGKHRKGAVHSAIFAFTSLLIVTGYLIWLIYVFSTAPGFGANPDCNKYTIYVIFGANIKATNIVFRWVCVAGFGSVLLASGIWVAIQVFTCCRASRKGYEQAEDPTTSTPFYSLFGHWAASAYIIAMLELIIKRNSLKPGIGEWTFGQLLAMVMLVGPLIEISALILRKLDRNGAQEDIEL